MRLGNDNLKNCVFCLSLRSPFTIFAVINREHPIGCIKGLKSK